MVLRLVSLVLYISLQKLHFPCAFGTFLADSGVKPFCGWQVAENGFRLLTFLLKKDRIRLQGPRPQKPSGSNLPPGGRRRRRPSPLVACAKQNFRMMKQRFIWFRCLRKKVASNEERVTKNHSPIPPCPMLSMVWGSRADVRKKVAFAHDIGGCTANLQHWSWGQGGSDTCTICIWRLLFFANTGPSF